MPVRPVWECVHYFAPVRLDRIEIANANLEQPATERVVDSGKEGVLVLACIAGCEEVGLTDKDGSDEARNVFRLVLEVRGIEHENAAARIQVSRTERVGDSTPHAVADRTQERIFGG
jgi:hypothetical protein